MGPQPTFNTGDDSIIVKEAAAENVHLALFGEILKRFNIVSERANANSNISRKVSCKRLQYHYKNAIGSFLRDNAKVLMMFGEGDAVKEMEDLLNFMLDTQKALESVKNADKAAKCAQEK